VNEAGPKAVPSSPSLELAPWPQVDFGSFGPIEVKPLSRVQKLVGLYLSRNWVMIPHVTHQDEADITALESLRKQLAIDQGLKLTPLAFLVKAIVSGLKAYPQFNASIDGSGKNLVLKNYFNIGVAVDTANGLLVPVVRDADSKSIVQIAKEISDVSQQARTKGLPIDRMTGGCFSISSLGSIGGTAFTPIINAPEVAILGVTKVFQKPMNFDGQLVWRMMLPLSLSYDHRVINGADAARFCIHLADALKEPGALMK
jgi:pyruvate dehydrogenase E2 component (dihydrolipoamide acetyltransferase)